MMSHEPKNPFCMVCNKAKTQRKPKFKGTTQLGPKLSELGELITGDILTKNKRNVTCTILDAGPDGEEDCLDRDLDISELANSALVLFDQGTG